MKGYPSLVTVVASVHKSAAYFDPTRKCTTLWGEPDRIHMQNLEQLHAYDIRT